MGLSKDYDHEKWVRLYKMAILGLERAKLTGRIEDTRIEMAARIVKLREVPGLHAEEISAIDKEQKDCPQHHVRQSAQIAAPQSAHSATARLLHGVPTSLSLSTCTIWQYWLMHTMRENAPDSVKPWGIWPELSSHCWHSVMTLLNAWRLHDFSARGDF
jgi:hypothetical protein